MKSAGKSFFRSRGARKAAALVVGLPLLLSSVGALPATAAPTQLAAPAAQQKNVDPNDYSAGRYIVVLTEKPAATYEGGTPGLQATKPRSGRKLDADRAEVRQYQAHLEAKQAALAEQENVQIRRQYTAALNGFSATLTADQAVNLAKNPGVLAVAPDTQQAPDYSTTDFLKLSGANGTWNKQFGGKAGAGKGVVVGVIDSGYTPGSKFFAGQDVAPLKGNPQVGVPYRTAGGSIAMLKADGSTFEGECQKGEKFNGTACNSKVLSARYFSDAFEESVTKQDRAPEELISPVDVGSHGTHTASTAAPATPTSRPSSTAAASD
ncbi:hypothetical protein QF036_000872 [Arthrobacter globiformis]|nr:hypothetical protein [Arthrobacter globiformis]